MEAFGFEAVQNLSCIVSNIFKWKTLKKTAHWFLSVGLNKWPSEYILHPIYILYICFISLSSRHVGVCPTEVEHYVQSLAEYYITLNSSLGFIPYREASMRPFRTNTDHWFNIIRRGPIYYWSIGSWSPSTPQTGILAPLLHSHC